MSVITHDNKVVTTPNGKALNFNELISEANETTGKNDKTLANAVGSLIDGYGGGGTSDHSQLINRDAADQHPMSAVTGLLAFAEYMDYIYYGISVPNDTEICNSANVAPGTKIYYKLTAQTGKSGYLDILDTTGTRITYLGKGSSGTTTNDYEGEYTLPENYGKIVVHGTGPLTPLYVTMDERYEKIKEYAREYRLEQNVFDVNRIQMGVRGIPIKPGVEYAEGWWLTEFFPVEHGDEITVNWFITTPYYGHMYYDDQKNAVGGVLMTQANTTFTVPSGVSYVRLAGNSTVNTSSARVTIKHLHAYLFRQNAERKHSEYERVILHPFGGFTDGKPYAAFPTLCFFGGKLVAAYRSSKTHLVPSSQDDWGGISVFSMTPDGFWKHEAFITGEGLGITGELRDPHLAVSPDGKHLYLSGPSTYTVSGVEHHDNYIIEIGTDFTVLGCYYEHDVEKLLRGPCLFTPNGNILYTAFSLSTGVGVYRSDAPFDGDLTALSFTEAADFHASGQQFDEGAIGYVNGSLYVIFRNEGGTKEAYISHTVDPEGLTGWTTPTSIGLKLHAPELLPTNAGDKFVFAGAYLDHYTSDQDRLRYPVIGLIDTTTDTVVCWGAVDDSVIGYSGYCGIVPFGDDEYGIIYYEDRGGTAVYYKRINLGYICPETAYLVPNHAGGGDSGTIEQASMSTIYNILNMTIDSSSYGSVVDTGVTYSDLKQFKYFSVYFGGETNTVMTNGYVRCNNISFVRVNNNRASLRLFKRERDGYMTISGSDGNLNSTGMKIANSDSYGTIDSSIGVAHCGGECYPDSFFTDASAVTVFVPAGYTPATSILRIDGVK